MSRAVLVLTSRHQREKAASWVWQAPSGTRLEFKETKRTLPQNARMWAMLTDIASQVTWHGQRLTPDDWKIVFMDALRREARMVPDIYGTGFVSLGWSSSDLTKSEMGDLMELIAMFGAQHGVRFGADESEAA
jgi:hypothetical protein